MLQKIRKENKGFTIIETLIVLAIAGLIMLIVFLAVPALERTARNTQRKNDVGNILSSINNYISNNGGVLPTTRAQLIGVNPTTNPFAVSDAKLGYYATDYSTIYLATTPQNPANIGSGTGSATSLTTDDVLVYVGFTCSSQTSPPTAASPRDVAIEYAIESSNGGTLQCQSD